MSGSSHHQFAPRKAALRALALIAGAGLLLAATPLMAEDFTFRRIAVPATEGGPRITVQIDPEEQARRLALPESRPTVTPVALPLPGGASPPGARYGWFWTRVPHATEAGRGRFLLAMEALRSPPEGAELPVPRVQQLQQTARAHGAHILRATIGTQVSPALVLAVITIESAGRADAVSRAGAQGLMQLIPATAERFGVSDPFDPAQNIAGGVRYLDWLLNEFDRDIVLALAGYNAGEGAVRRSGGVPPYAETRDYVPLVLAAWNIARGLCTTQPELPTDGCVFAVARDLSLADGG